MIFECYNMADYKSDYGYPGLGHLGYGQCRICARTDKSVTNVFSYEGIKYNLVQKIQTCLNIHVTQWDHLPQSVCETCIARLTCYYDLMTDFYHGQKQFAEQKPFYYAQEMKMEENEVTDYRIISKVNYDDRKMEVKTYTELHPSKPIKLEDPVKTEESQEPCKCSQCDTLKYGGLPLLTEAIEQREREQSLGQYVDNRHADRVRVRVLESPRTYSANGSECIECYQKSDTVKENKHPSENYIGGDMHSSFRLSESNSKIIHDFNDNIDIKNDSDNIVYHYDVNKSVIKNYPPNEGYVYHHHEPAVTNYNEHPVPLGAHKDENIQVEDLSDKTNFNLKSVKAKDKNLKCEFCDKLFGHMGDLNKHRRIHTNEKPYPCRICGKKFAHTSNLLRHERVHSGEKPFPCSVCGKVFGRKDKLISHTKSKLCKKRAKKLIVD